jgi:hypothetical protein
MEVREMQGPVDDGSLVLTETKVATVGELMDILALIPQDTPLAVKITDTIYYTIKVGMFQRFDGKIIYCVVAIP